MKYFAMACAMTAILASMSAASRPSQEVLGEMGLEGMTVMSDSEGLEVRGFGYSPVSASGYGWASVRLKGGSAGSVNKYSSKGKHSAWGSNESEAGVIVTGGGSHGSHGGHGGKAVIAFSGGSSRAGKK